MLHTLNRMPNYSEPCKPVHNIPHKHVFSLSFSENVSTFAVGLNGNEFCDVQEYFTIILLTVFGQIYTNR